MRTLIARRDTTEPTVIDRADLDPALDSGAVLVDVVASSVNPIDHFVASGDAHPVFGLPDQVGLGWDVVGRVRAVGADVAGLAPGDLVAGLHDDLTAATRAHATQVVLPAAALAIVPDGVAPLDAASVPLNALTADQALRPLGAGDGRSILITGAAGAVGGYAVALAAADGWVVTGLARVEDERWVRAAGAEHFVTQAAPATYDVVFDTAILVGPALAAVRDGGTYVGVMPPAQPPTERGVRVTAVQVRADGARLATLLARTASGDLEARVAGTAALEDAAAVYAKVAAGGQRGRWVLEA